jgi:hypothetical protein
MKKYLVSYSYKGVDSVELYPGNNISEVLDAYLTAYNPNDIIINWIAEREAYHGLKLAIIRANGTVKEQV